jgi:CelD/BcsL family acetyltransferase involved in cellulose biosynthesis
LDNNLTINNRTLDDLDTIYRHQDNGLNWNLVFTLPAWLKVWWASFKAGFELYIRTVEQDHDLVGIAPLQVRDKTVSFIGNVDVCDYQDFILVPGRETLFFNALLGDLTKNGITDLHLETIRPDSSVVTHLIPLVQTRGFQIDYHPSDVSSDMLLPATWEDYLSTLDGKQRHEIKRKIRNFGILGEVNYRCVEDKTELAEAIETFLKLFPESRGDKAQFLTSAMQNYFRQLTLSLAEVDVVRIGILEFNHRPVAMVMFFEYNDGVYLYNSAYDPDYRANSVGIISKVSCIRDSLEKKKKVFDFLKGPEVYKSYLGGRTLQLFSCHIKLR